LSEEGKLLEGKLHFSKESFSKEGKLHFSFPRKERKERGRREFIKDTRPKTHDTSPGPLEVPSPRRLAWRKTG